MAAHPAAGNRAANLLARLRLLEAEARDLWLVVRDDDGAADLAEPAFGARHALGDAVAALEEVAHRAR